MGANTLTGLLPRPDQSCVEQAKETIDPPDGGVPRQNDIMFKHIMAWGGCSEMSGEGVWGGGGGGGWDDLSAWHCVLAPSNTSHAHVR